MQVRTNEGNSVKRGKWIRKCFHKECKKNYEKGALLLKMLVKQWIIIAEIYLVWKYGEFLLSHLKVRGGMGPKGVFLPDIMKSETGRNHFSHTRIFNVRYCIWNNSRNIKQKRHTLWNVNHLLIHLTKATSIDPGCLELHFKRLRWHFQGEARYFQVN